MTTSYFKNQNGTIAYDDRGRGPLVVCVPSLGDIRAEYRFLAPQLISAGYRVVTMDVRGHGETSTEWDDFSVAGVGSDIVALIRHLDAGPAFLIGTSMAAGAAAWAAVEAPRLVSGIVMISPFVEGETPGFVRAALNLMFARPWGPGMWMKYFNLLYPTRKPDDFEQYSAALRANLQEKGRLEAVRQMFGASKAASGARLSQVKAPVLVLVGSKDRDFKDPEAHARQLAERLYTGYEVIPDAGHYPHVEMPEITGQLIVSFLQGQTVAEEQEYAAQRA